MGNRNVLAVLVVIFVAVLLYNVLYFTGVIGNFGQNTTASGIQPAEPEEGSVFDIPGLDREPIPRAQPQASAPRGQGPAPMRPSLDTADLGPQTSWGRNPFFTPREIWAIENFRPLEAVAQIDPPTGLRLSAIVVDSSGRRVAVVNNEILSPGDVISGYEVVEVWNDAVVFRVGDSRHVLRMVDAAIGLRVRGGAVGRY